VVLLLLGVVLRTIVPIFQWLYIPASVIAGATGLGLVQFGGTLVADLSVTLRS